MRQIGRKIGVTCVDPTAAYHKPVAVDEPLGEVRGFDSSRSLGILMLTQVFIEMNPPRLINTYQESESTDVGLETEGLVDHLGCGYWSEHAGDWRTDGMVLGALRMDTNGDVPLVECDTFHLSAFSSRQDSTTPEWRAADLLTGFSLFGEVGCRVPLGFSSATYM